jgi:hypothetical protein
VPGSQTPEDRQRELEWFIADLRVAADLINSH